MSDGVYTQHLIMNLAGFDDFDIYVNERVKEVLLHAIQKSGATIINVIDHHFDPYGYTCVILLAESHASVHTYPEDNAMFIDFYTCGSPDVNEFIRTIIQELNPLYCEYYVFDRVL